VQELQKQSVDCTASAPLAIHLNIYQVRTFTCSGVAVTNASDAALANE
jgi:hypothetical protein